MYLLIAVLLTAPGGDTNGVNQVGEFDTQEECETAASVIRLAFPKYPVEYHCVYLTRS